MYTPLLYTIRATCSAHSILLDFISRTIFGEEYRSISNYINIFNVKEDFKLRDLKSRQ
jgi:hypothetical protein